LFITASYAGSNTVLF
nr:immunoglobulin light chain junction region [Macaca mulatta]